MKTICRLADFNPPNVSIYLFEDSKPVEIASDKTTIGDPANPDFYIADCNSSNCVLYENTTNPDEYAGWKYFYTPDGGWVLNPDWIPPEPITDPNAFQI